MSNQTGRWPGLRAYLTQQQPRTEEELKAAVEGLGRWDKRAWVAAALGAFKCALAYPYNIRPEMQQAIAAAHQWLECPCEHHALLAEEARHRPTGLWTNCNDRLHVSRLAAAALADLAAPGGSLDKALRVAMVLAHPLAFDIEEVWRNIVLGIEEHLGIDFYSDSETRAVIEDYEQFLQNLRSIRS
jgi:hypothetical protein